MGARVLFATLAAGALGAVGVLDGCRSTPAVRGGTGIAGVVRATPRKGVGEASGGAYSDPGAPERIDYARLKGIVVWIDDLPGEAKAPPADPAASPAIASLHEDRFEPDVLAVAAGDPLFVRNLTAGGVTLFAEGAIEETFVPAGQQGEVRCSRPGPVLALAQELDLPRLHVLVAPSRRSLVLSSGDDFAFDLPPGEHVVAAWHWRLPIVRRSVRVEAGKVSQVELVVSVDELSRAGSGR